MLLKYGARNFASFKEGLIVSFELGNKCPTSISKGKKVTNLLCVKGANGSGKTNALKIISFIADFCCRSFEYKPEDDLEFDSFFFNDDPTDIFCEFATNGAQYYYEAQLTNSRIYSETMFRKRKKSTKIFERKNNQLSYCINEYSELNTVKLRSNASIISTAHQYEIDQISSIYKFFDSIKCNVIRSGRYEMISDEGWISKFYYDYPDVFEFVKKIIRKCDLGISDINIYSRENEKGNETYFPMFTHKANTQNNELHYIFQSSGTKALFKVLMWYKLIIDGGGVLGLDEFDVNFHPDILPVLVELFDNEEINIKDAQLVFTTHNTKIMDQMGKYRTFLINQENSESYGYRLDEIPGDILRNDRSIASVYRTGKIGGVPKV